MGVIQTILGKRTISQENPNQRLKVIHTRTIKYITTPRYTKRLTSTFILVEKECKT